MTGETAHLYQEFGRELLRAHERAAVLPHYGERALERENTLAMLLNERIPTRYRATRGFIAFGDGLDDQQMDCIIYDSLNYGTRSSLAGNTIVLAKSVAAVFLETLNLTQSKFRDDVVRIETLKKHCENDCSYDPLGSAIHNQPLAYIIAHHAEDRGASWDVLQAYQDEFQRLDQDGERWRHLVDGVLLLQSGDLLSPVFQDEAGGMSRVVLSNTFLETLPSGVVGLLDGPGSIDAADYLCEQVRTYLMRFKNPNCPNTEMTAELQVNVPPARLSKFKRCFKVTPRTQR